MGNRKARWFKLFGGILVSVFLLAILIAAVLYLRLSTVIQSLRRMTRTSLYRRPQV
jgi:uncharacterized membrane protein